MLAEFETQLANVLGSRVGQPCTGKVDRAPGRGTARLLVALGTLMPIADNLQSLRSERVPGASTFRRVLRLRCEVSVTATGADSRGDQVAAIDAALFTLDDPDFRTGAALLPADDSDPGFLISRMTIARVDAPAAITLEADGLFWPVGATGETGMPIVSIALRAALKPLRLVPENLRLVAGGAPVDLTLVTPSAGAATITKAGVSAGPPLEVTIRVVDAGHRPGAGTLGGGVDGGGGARRLDLAKGDASFTYTPPAAPALDFLVVSMSLAAEPSVELARFALTTRAGA